MNENSSISVIHPPGKPWTTPEAATHLKISERHLWRQIDAARVHVFRIGRRVLLPDQEMDRIKREGC